MGLIEHPVAHRLVAEEHVLDDVQVVAQGEVLIDRRDAERLGVPGPVEMDLPALPQDLPAAGPPEAGDGLDQRRLAGAVVSDERRDLALRVSGEVDIGQGPHGAERLGDPAQLQQRAVTARRG